MTDPLHVLIIDDEPHPDHAAALSRRGGLQVERRREGAGMRAVLAREVIHPGCRHPGRKQPYDRDFGALPDITG
jgi:hypothetical protein